METANTPAVLLLDLPPKALAGIDLLAFTTTQRFRGVKNLPGGVHLVFCGASTAISERHGLWFWSGGGGDGAQRTGDGTLPLFVARWNVALEALEAVVDPVEVMRWRANLGSLWREGLTPYRQTAGRGMIGEGAEVAGVEEDEDQEDVDDWPVLTSAITPALLTRITGGDMNHWSLTSASSARGDLEDIPGLDDRDKEELQADKELHLLPVDLKQTWQPGVTGRERTLHAQDRSWALEHIMDGSTSSSIAGSTPRSPSTSWQQEVLGELQFCFLMILTLNNFSCLEQWKRLLSLVFTCKAGVANHSSFFVRAIAALRLQLQHCKDAEGGLIDLADEAGSLLKSLLVGFRKGVEDGLASTHAGVQDVLEELDDLEDYLRDEHHWQFAAGGAAGREFFVRSGMLELEDGEQVPMESTAFDEEDELGEFAPQIVELTPEQARLLNVTPEDAKALGASLNKTSLSDKKVADVVQDSGDDEDDNEDELEQSDEDEDEEDEEEDEEEETQDLDDMDARY